VEVVMMLFCCCGRRRQGGEGACSVGQWGRGKAV
jgi:hypothetical protein